MPIVTKVSAALSREEGLLIGTACCGWNNPWSERGDVGGFTLPSIPFWLKSGETSFPARPHQGEFLPLQSLDFFQRRGTLSCRGDSFCQLFQKCAPRLPRSHVREDCSVPDCPGLYLFAPDVMSGSTLPTVAAALAAQDRCGFPNCGGVGLWPVPGA